MPVVFVHSGVTDSREWDAVLPAFGADETATPEYWSSADRVETILSSYAGAATLVGTSFGGRIVLETAVIAPERVERIVLVNANIFGWSEEVAAVGAQEDELVGAGRLDEAAELMVRWWLVGPRREPDDVAAPLRARARELARRTYDVGEPKGGLDELDLAQVRVPVLVVRGALDWADVERAAQRFVDELPDAREVVIDGVAHLPALERPTELARVVHEFLGT
jgi:pimeloyl-ACP methyl ester carboxylesterase